MKHRAPPITNDDFDGIMVGGFILYPQIEARTLYDDNVYRTRNNATEDYIYDVIPRLTASTNWNRHFLGISSEYDIGSYRNNSRSDYKNFHVTASGRYDIAPETNLAAKLERVRKQAGTTGFEDQNQARDGYNFTTLGELSLERKLSYIQTKAYFRKKRTDFAQISSGDYLSLDNDTYGLDLSYVFLPDCSIFVATTIDDMDYTKTDFSSLSSNGYDGRLGIKYDTGSLYSWSAFAGHTHKSFNNNVDDFGNNYVGGSASWEPTALSKLEFSIDNKFLETTEQASVGIKQTTRKLSFSQSITPFLDSTVFAGVDTYKYVSATNTPGRKHDLYYAGVSGNYKISDTVNLQLNYGHYQRESSVSSNEYRNNQATISIVYRR